MTERLVIASKVKAYVKEKSGHSTSDRVMDVLTQHVMRLIDAAIEKTNSDGRKTLLDRDFH